MRVIIINCNRVEQPEAGGRDRVDRPAARGAAVYDAGIVATVRSTRYEPRQHIIDFIITYYLLYFTLIDNL